MDIDVIKNESKNNGRIEIDTDEANKKLDELKQKKRKLRAKKKKNLKERIFKFNVFFGKDTSSKNLGNLKIFEITEKIKHTKTKFLKMGTVIKFICPSKTFKLTMLSRIKLN